MGFLTPLFFAGLAALAVPIVVHLMHRERRDVVEFPSLMFLRKIPYHSLRRQKLRHLLLLALRVLGLVLLVAAFTRPYLARRATAAGLAAPSAREVVILLDRSYSMAYGDRWARAADAARQAVDDLGAGDRASLVLFSESAASVAAPTADKGALRAAIAAARPGSGITRYAPAIRVAQGLLEKSELPRRSVLLISDFQRSGWNPREVARLPEGATFETVDVAVGESPNLAIVAGGLRREHAEGRERVIASARVANRSDGARELEATLDVNGRRMESRRLSVPANGSVTLTFAPIPLPEGGARGTIRVGKDELPQDDAFHFAATRGRTLSVLVVEPDDAPQTTSLFLRRVLAIGDQPLMTPEVRRVGRLAPRDLDGRALVVLNDVPVPSGELGRRIAEQVRAGGGLLVVLGERSAPQRWSAEALALAGARPAAPVDRSAERGGALGTIDRGHPVFRPFAAPRSGDFSAARFYRYRPLDPAEGSAVLARFDDGTVALAEHRAGRGRVLVWGSTLDNFWNDLALQPVFLPFVHQLVRHATGYVDERAWYTVGEALAVAAPGDSLAMDAKIPAGDWTVVTPGGERHRAGTAVELDEQGLYEIRAAGASAGAARWIAVNLDPRESDFARLDPQELALAVAALPTASRAASAIGDETAEEREGRQRLWWYLLAAALLCLAAETALSNRLSRAAR